MPIWKGSLFGTSFPNVDKQDSPSTVERDTEAGHGSVES